MAGLSRGKRASGDLIPWTMAQQFLDDDFPSLSGARVVRVATSPEHQRCGYGTRAMQLLQRYYQHQILSIDEGDEEAREIAPLEEDEVPLLEETIKPRENLPPLLLRLSERKPETLDYLGVSFGLTQPLLR